jgi:predicted nucleic acid-binding protein
LIYIDTSVLAAYYCPEPLSQKAQRALAQADELAVSSLVELEFASAIARKVRTHEMRRSDAQRILAVFQSHLEQGIFTRLAVDGAHFAKAREWLASLVVPLQTLDALHVALAAMKGCSIMTADAVLAKACAKVGVAARLIA